MLNQFTKYCRAHATGGLGGPWPLNFFAEQITFIEQKENSLKTRLGSIFLSPIELKYEIFSSGVHHGGASGT